MVEPVWKKRFDSLNSRIEALSDLLDTAGLFDRKEVLQHLVSSLEAFARRQFDYFYDGFNDGTLQPASAWPVDHVMTAILEQISYDLEAIRWAAEQRRQDDSAMEWALRVGDKLTWQALQPAVEPFNLPDTTTVLVYFQKFAEIRMIPYAPVALIGLPITCVPTQKDGQTQMVTRDYLAIPHEVGHYVYWHGSVKAKGHQWPLSQHIQGPFIPQMGWGREWLEELFADVYGCLIAGPIIAQSFQDLQMRVSEDRFFADDGEHPVPLVRPDIYTKVLQKAFSKAWAKYMNNRWRGKRDRRTQHEQNGRSTFHYKRTGETKEMSDVISLIDSQDNDLISKSSDKPLDIAVNKLLQLLTPTPDTLPLATNWWRQSYGQSPPEDDELYGRFTTYFWQQFNDPFSDYTSVNQVEMPTPPAPVGEKSLDDLYGTWEYIGQERLRTKVYAQELQKGASKAAAEQAAEEAVNREPMSWVIWQAVFEAGGWATKGPETNPIGG
jgi:hypothetical protein